jgi:hypothetical protein
MFQALPSDIKRIVFLFLTHKDIKKLDDEKFYEDGNDVYWKMKLAFMVDEIPQEGFTYRDYYDYLLYVKPLKEQPWNLHIWKKLIDDERFIEEYFDNQSSSKETALSYAVRLQLVGDVGELIDAGANVNNEDDTGNTALSYACDYSSSHQVEIVNLLIDAGADVNHRNMYYWTPLDLAINGCKVKIVELLLQKGATVTDTTRRLASHCKTNKKEIRELLDGRDPRESFWNKVVSNFKYFS